MTQVVGEVQTLDGESLRLLEHLTATDRLFLRRLSSDGLLARRSPQELDEEFAATADRLGFRLVARPRA